MKKTILCCLVFIANLSTAQNNYSSKDSISIFYDSLLSVLKTDYLHTKDVNWGEIESSTRENLTKYTLFSNSLEEITTLFDQIHATHSTVYKDDVAYSGTYSGPIETDFSEQWLKKYITNPEFEVKIIDDCYGYVLIPNINFEDISYESIHSFAQPMYDQIAELKQSKRLKGWIIDLRYCFGGNIQPILLALSDLLGNTNVWGALDVEKKKIISQAKLKNGQYFENDTLISYIEPKGKSLRKKPVAFITGVATASSGEITVMSFIGRKQVTIIGEQTAGMTTTNEKRYLPFDFYMALTVAYDCDRNGKYYDFIVPDIALSKEDNFDDLRQDKNIQKAIEFFMN